MKEDKQAFGCLVGKAISPKEAHSYPLTSVPLALAESDRILRKGAKSNFRNMLIEDLESLKSDPLIRSNWIFDGMAMIRRLNPCK